MPNPTKPLLSVRNLKTSFFQDEGTTRAVDGASFDVFPGKTLGIVGESGCGKASPRSRSCGSSTAPAGSSTERSF